MLPYPEQEVERILTEEVARMEATGAYTRPRARVRLGLLFMERLCAAWHKPAARVAIDALAEAHCYLMEQSRDMANGPVYWFAGEKFERAFTAFRDCDEAIGRVLAAYSDWPDPGGCGTAADMAEYLTGILRSLHGGRENMRASIQAHGKIGLVTRVFEDYHDAIGVAHGALLSPEEEPEYSAQANRAIAQFVACRSLFLTPTSGTAKD